MLRHIEHKSSVPTHPGRIHVLRLLNHLRHEGEEGTHVYLVFPVLGRHPGLQTVKFGRGRIPVAVIKENSSRGWNFCTENAASSHW